MQRDLAEVLKRISHMGPAGLYEGDVASAIEEDMSSNGGFITRQDLAEYRQSVSSPLTGSFRDYKVLAPTAPCASWTALEMLNVLGNFDLRSMGHNSTEYLHTFMEGSRHAFADRYRYMGDTDFAAVPLKDLLSKEYAKEIAGQLELDRAVVEGISDEPPWAYFESRDLHDPWQFEGRSRPADPPGRD